MTSPPMLLGRKLLKKLATRSEPSSVRAGHVHVLRLEQQVPAPDAGERRSRGRRRARRPATAATRDVRSAQSACHVDAREEKRQQREADHELRGSHQVASACDGARWIFTDMRGEGQGTTVLRFRAKISATMRILMIAPEPFFEPRGTPFSEFHRIRALTALGHQVDLVTYPFGQDVSMPGLRVFRSLRPPFVRRRQDRSVGWRRCRSTRCWR